MKHQVGGGKPHERFFRLSEDCTSLQWGPRAGKYNRDYPIAEMKWIAFGPYTDCQKRSLSAAPWRCFSLITDSNQGYLIFTPFFSVFPEICLCIDDKLTIIFCFLSFARFSDDQSMYLLIRMRLLNVVTWLFNLWFGIPSLLMIVNVCPVLVWSSNAFKWNCDLWTTTLPLSFFERLKRLASIAEMVPGLISNICLMSSTLIIMDRLTEVLSIWFLLSVFPFPIVSTLLVGFSLSITWMLVVVVLIW